MKRILSLVIATAWLAAPGAQATGWGSGSDRIDVMTQNQYLGADLTPIVTAGNPQEFNDAVITALENIAANDIPTRAELLAKLIARRLPELVGLQEIFAFQCTDLAPPTPDQGCDNPRIRNAFNDHLALTLDALIDLGEVYQAVATVVNLDTSGIIVPPVPFPGIPFNIDGYPAVVNLVDRDVILARDDIAGGAQAVDFTGIAPGICSKPSAQGCNYVVVASATLPDPDGPGPLVGPVLNIERGFVGVDVTVDGKDYRFIDTHLEVQEPEAGNPFSAVVQAAQAQELIQTLLFTTPPNTSLIVVGDINSSDEDPPIVVPPAYSPPLPPVIVPPYAQFVGSGYIDSWTLRRGNRPGYTCCQLDDLSNFHSVADERIDVIFSFDELRRARKARVLGVRIPSKSSPHGLWPSDHGSVATTLVFD